MKKLLAIAHGDILSYRLESDEYFKDRSVDQIELNILKAIAVEKNFVNAVANLATLYSCKKAEVLKRISELSLEIFNNPNDLKNTSVAFYEKDNSIPLHIIAEITERCNMFCGYCYGSFGITNLPEIGFNKWKQFLSVLLDKEMQQETCQLLNITGGEPTMNNDLLEILKWTSGKFAVSLFINCMKVDNRLINVLKDHSSLIRINTSFDSSTASIDEFMRGKGFPNRLANLIKLNSLGLRITINIGLWKRQIEEIEETIKYFTQFTNAKVYLMRINKEGRAKNLNHEIFLTDDEYETLVKRIKLDLHFLGDRFHFEGLKKAITNADEGKTYRCNCGFGVIVINPQGILKPCVQPLCFFEELGVSRFTTKLSINSCKDAVGSLINSVNFDIPVTRLENGCVLPYLSKRKYK